MKSKVCDLCLKPTFALKYLPSVKDGHTTHLLYFLSTDNNKPWQRWSNIDSASHCFFSMTFHCTAPPVSSYAALFEYGLYIQVIYFCAILMKFPWFHCYMIILFVIIKINITVKNIFIFYNSPAF